MNNYMEINAGYWAILKLDLKKIRLKSLKLSVLNYFLLD
ncbi:hypothetical protein MSWAN_0644 [Methanobacterium paludis]|uniref:Uncharacterized protein n=1 Tax=Methanobacterium paludis (strain DSM 25820 / JCM 18151 / SWAN1) TaxID=868131 RepID=F6D632_METPW|nr:hypothetical protein MSWAN_0644 [Methanobacterium paludis]